MDPFTMADFHPDIFATPQDFHFQPVSDTSTYHIDNYNSRMLPEFALPKLEEEVEPEYATYSGSTGATPTPFFAASSTPESVRGTTPKAPRGRSLGDQSSQPIKNLRARAAKGDIEAALKLGWAVDRLTEIFNNNKIAKGEMVSLDKPIDDEDLLARIHERHLAQSQAAKKRADRLKVLAEAGDYEAAKKLKYGAKKMAELFPEHHGQANSSISTPTPAGRANVQAPKPSGLSLLRKGGFNMSPPDVKPQRINSAPQTWTAPSFQALTNSLPKPYPMPEADHHIELRLKEELKEAELEAARMQEALTIARKASVAAAEKVKGAQERIKLFRVSKSEGTAVRPRKVSKRANLRSNFIGD